MGNLFRSSVLWVLILQLALPIPLARAQDIEQIKEQMQTISEPVGKKTVTKTTPAGGKNPSDREADDSTNWLYWAGKKIFGEDNRAWTLGLGGVTLGALLLHRKTVADVKASKEAVAEANGSGVKPRFVELQKKFPEMKAKLAASEAKLAAAEARLAEVIKTAPEDFKKPLLESVGPEACATYFGKLGASWRRWGHENFGPTIRTAKSAGSWIKDKWGKWAWIERPRGYQGKFSQVDGPEVKPVEETPVEGAEAAKPEAPAPVLSAQQIATMKQYEAGMKEVERRYVEHRQTVAEIYDDVYKLTGVKLELKAPEDLKQKNPVGTIPVFDHPSARSLIRTMNEALDTAEGRLAEDVGLRSTIINKEGDLVKPIEPNPSTREGRLILEAGVVKDGYRRRIVRPHLLEPATWVEADRWSGLLRDNYLLWANRSPMLKWENAGRLFVNLSPLTVMIIAAVTQENIRTAKETAVKEAEDDGIDEREKLAQEKRAFTDNMPLMQVFVSTLHRLWAEYLVSEEKPLLADAEFPLAEEEDMDTDHLVIALWGESMEESEAAKRSTQSILWTKILTRMKYLQLPSADQPEGPQGWLKAEAEVAKDPELRKLADTLGLKINDALRNPKDTGGLAIEARQLRALVAMLLWTRAQIKMGEKFPFPPTAEPPVLFGDGASDAYIDAAFRRARLLAEAKPTGIEFEFWVQILLAAEIEHKGISRPTNDVELSAAEEQVRNKHKDLITEWAQTGGRVLLDVLPAALQNIKETELRAKEKPAEKAPDKATVPTPVPAAVPAADPKATTPGPAPAATDEKKDKASVPEAAPAAPEKKPEEAKPAEPSAQAGSESAPK